MVRRLCCDSRKQCTDVPTRDQAERGEVQIGWSQERRTDDRSASTPAGVKAFQRLSQWRCSRASSSGANLPLSRPPLSKLSTLPSHQCWKRRRDLAMYRRGCSRSTYRSHCDGRRLRTWHSFQVDHGARGVDLLARQRSNRRSRQILQQQRAEVV
jgi:hypothetical protein